ncbi:hypothetical protein [Leifsonia sp. NPDC080035]|uniref:Uncharacterized protein n=1 Tax=Leifsonia sp. NPDC080035 TaxID=3143936 RepID=A0AAU7GF61_9MICO
MSLFKNLFAAKPAYTEAASISTPYVPEQFTYDLARDLELAQSPHLKDDEEYRLANSPEPIVRATLAANPSSSEGILNLLAVDAEVNVRANAFRNENLPIALSDDGYPTDEGMVGQFLDYADVGDPDDVRILRALLTRENLPTLVIQLIATLRDEESLYAEKQLAALIVQHPNTAPEIRDDLSHWLASV